MPATYHDLNQRLRTTLKDLQSQLATTESTVREDGVGYSNHMADAGTEVFEQARDVALVRQLKQSLSDVQRALAKFDDGTFGLCEGCGSVIELARLEAVPAARYCLDCQTRHEASR